ncbi:MAG: Lrp/AsnC ligand binding domain-containing protein [Sedimenticola sp.]
MVTSIILLNTERNMIQSVAEQLTEDSGVSEVYSVSGPYDLIAIVRVASNDDLAELVTSRIAKIEGITSTDTMLAFRSFSKHDLESMFTIGE